MNLDKEIEKGMANTILTGILSFIIVILEYLTYPEKLTATVPLLITCLSFFFGWTCSLFAMKNKIGKELEKK